MRIKATGTVLDNASDGRTVKVAWDPPTEPRDWYFYTYRTTIVEADPEAEDGRRLIDFTFRGVTQDYAWFLAQPYWLEKYGAKSETIAADISESSLVAEDEEIAEEESPYSIENIVAEGCFLTSAELSEILDRWRSKTNLILQGPYVERPARQVLFSDISSCGNGAVICPAFQRGHGPLALMKFAMRGANQSDAL